MTFQISRRDKEYWKRDRLCSALRKAQRIG